MTRHACPVCGDPNAFPLWIETDPPETCPDDPAWPRRSLQSICQMQLTRARHEAERRKITPEGFDANGVIIPGMAALVFGNWIRMMQSPTTTSTAHD